MKKWILSLALLAGFVFLPTWAAGATPGCDATAASYPKVDIWVDNSLGQDISFMVELRWGIGFGDVILYYEGTRQGPTHRVPRHELFAAGEHTIAIYTPKGSGYTYLDIPEEGGTILVECMSNGQFNFRFMPGFFWQ